MKGLLIKDFFTLMRQFFAYFAIMVIFSMAPGNGSVVMAVIMASMLPLTALAYDERCKWDQLAAAMPYTATQMVLSKYLLGLIVMVCALALSVLVWPIQALLGLSVESGEFQAMALGALCSGLLMQGIMLFLAFRFGTEKSRLFMMVVTFIIVLGGGLALKLIEESGWKASDSLNMTAVAVCFLACSLLVYLVSIPLSVRAYLRRC